MSGRQTHQTHPTKRGIRWHLDRGIEGVWLFFSLVQVRHRVRGMYGVTWPRGFVGVMLTEPDPASHKRHKMP